MRDQNEWLDAEALSILDFVLWTLILGSLIVIVIGVASALALVKWRPALYF